MEIVRTTVRTLRNMGGGRGRSHSPVAAEIEIGAK